MTSQGTDQVTFDVSGPPAQIRDFRLRLVENKVSHEDAIAIGTAWTGMVVAVEEQNVRKFWDAAKSLRLTISQRKQEQEQKQAGEEQDRKEEAVAAQQTQDLRLSFNRTHLPTLSNLARGAERHLQDLLIQAGLEGEIQVSLVRQVMGRPHTQGIKLSRYDQSGVLLTVQPGGNDTRIEVNVHPPQGIDAPTLHKRLKEILEPEEGEEHVAETGTQLEQPTETSAIDTEEATLEVTPEAANQHKFEVLSVEEAQRRTGTALSPSLGRFVHDRDKVQLLLLEVEKFLQEVGREWLTSSQMTQVFERLMGQPVNPSSLGPILKRLCDRGDLVRTDARSGGYRYGLTTPAPATASTPGSRSLLHGFAKEEERVKLLISRIEELQRENGQDFLTGSQLTEAVRRVAEQPINGKATSGIRKILVERGQLEVAGHRHNRIYRLKSAAPSAEPVVSSDEVQVPSTSLLEQVRERTFLARQWEEADGEGRELDARLAELEEQAAPIRARLEELRPVRENPQARQAAEEVAEIRRELLGE